VRRLVADGLDVRAVVPAIEQGLEDFFLELTQSSDVDAPAGDAAPAGAVAPADASTGAHANGAGATGTSSAPDGRG